MIYIFFLPFFISHCHNGKILFLLHNWKRETKKNVVQYFKFHKSFRSIWQFEAIQWLFAIQRKSRSFFIQCGWKESGKSTAEHTSNPTKPSISVKQIYYTNDRTKVPNHTIFSNMNHKWHSIIAINTSGPTLCSS